jgi:hypothetical protein
MIQKSSLPENLRSVSRVLTSDTFREMVRMADCALDQPCPSCGSQAQRMLSAPFFADSGDTTDTPAQRVQGAAGSWRHMCGFGCRH